MVLMSPSDEHNIVLTFLKLNDEELSWDNLYKEFMSFCKSNM